MLLCSLLRLLRCACGQLVAAHVASSVLNSKSAEDNQLVHLELPQEKWSVLKHTRTYPTDAYGTIEFQGGGFINKAMVRVITGDPFPLPSRHQ